MSSKTYGKCSVCGKQRYTSLLYRGMCLTCLFKFIGEKDDKIAKLEEENKELKKTAVKWEALESSHEEWKDLMNDKHPGVLKKVKALTKEFGELNEAKHVIDSITACIKSSSNRFLSSIKFNEFVINLFKKKGFLDENKKNEVVKDE